VSRIYRQTVTIEVVLLAGDRASRHPPLVDVEAIVREAIQVDADHDDGGVWIVAGDSSVTTIEELTP
jgi:hypothetical protein